MTADQAAALLRTMQAGGIDTAGAADLTGDALERWIDAALDKDFEQEFSEFHAARAAAALTLRSDE